MGKVHYVVELFSFLDDLPKLSSYAGQQDAQFVIVSLLSGS
jgi:hypothetical protein